MVFEEAGGGCTSYVPGFPTGHDVINEFNNHYGLCSFMGHGGACNVALATIYYNSYYLCNHTRYTGNADETKYKITSFDNGSGGCCLIAENGNGFDNMTNADYPSINYSISCETMPFDDFGTPAGDRNMGETYTCITTGGGPAYIGNTRNGYVTSSYLLFEQFIKVITDNTSFNLGIAEATSKQNYNDRYLRFSHNLIGCPETEMWTGIPSVFNNVTITDGGYYVTVNTGGVSDCNICVQSALDNGAGFFQTKPGPTATFNHYLTQPYIITITRHNYIPYIKNPDNIYVQNETISSDKYIYGKYFYAGSNVTPSKPQGPVLIQAGSSVVFDAENDAIIQGSFEVQAGASFEIK